MNNATLIFSLVETSITLDLLWEAAGRNEILHHAMSHIDKEIDGLDVRTCEVIHLAYVKGLAKGVLVNQPTTNRTNWVEDALEKARRENAARASE